MKKMLLLVATICCSYGVALADEGQTSCESECGAGQVQVGYADGNGSSCQCAATAEVQNPEIPEAGEAYDGQSS